VQVKRRGRGSRMTAGGCERPPAEMHVNDQHTASWSVAGVFALLAGGLLAAALPGCGYSQADVYPDGVKTVVVPMFENKTFYRGVEFDLTEAVVKEIELRTPYKVVSNEEVADTRLTGTVVDLRQHQGSRRRPGGLPQEMEITLTVDFEWRDMRTQENLTQREGFVVAGNYLPTRGLGERFETGQHQAVGRMAERIVSEMRSPW